MIELYDGYFISVDAYNFTLSKHTGKFDKRTGAEITKIIGYYSTLEGALNDFAKYLAKKKMESESMDFGKAIGILKQEYKRLEDFLRSTIPEYEVVERR